MSQNAEDLSYIHQVDGRIRTGTALCLDALNRFRFKNTMARGKMTVNITGIAVNAWSSTAQNGEVFDTDTVHDSSSNNSRFVAKIAGKYLAIHSALFDTSGVTTPTLCGIRFIVNGGTTTVYGNQTAHPPAGNALVLTSATLLTLAANDYVEAQSIVVGSSGTYALEGSDADNPGILSTQLVYLGE